MTALATAGARIAAWRRDPVLFVRDNFGVEPDAWQGDDVLVPWADDVDPLMRRIAMKACAGPGKSTAMAWAAWHFLATRGEKGEHPNAYAVSITGDNLKDNLWKEMAKWRDRSEFLCAAFEWTAEKVFAKNHPATWWLKARTWPKSADEQAIGRTLSGLHSKYIAYFIDESGDIPTGMLRTCEQGLGNCTWGKILTGGNTTSQNGLLYEAAVRQRHLWHVVSITADPKSPKRTPRVDAAWAQQQIDTYGRDNPWVMAFVLGEFPPGGLNTLLSVEDIETAMKRELPDHAYTHIQKRIGVDVARFGDDATVLFPRQGLRAFNFVEMRNARTNAIAARLLVGKEKFGSEMEFIDDTGGWAAGVIDQALLAGVTIVPVNMSGKPIDPRYFNRRSEIHFLAAEWVKAGGWLPNLPILIRQACAATYYFDAGKLRVEEKDQVKKKLNGASPDHWEALMLTFALPDMPASVESLIPGYTGERGGMKSDWDPFGELTRGQGSFVS